MKKMIDPHAQCTLWRSWYAPTEHERKIDPSETRMNYCEQAAKEHKHDVFRHAYHTLNHSKTTKKIHERHQGNARANIRRGSKPLSRTLHERYEITSREQRFK